MRPESLELDGFTVFREPTRVDFADADLFAFTGPTGAGKSSLIDAMIFALYGSVPRLDERAVSPVISQGRQDARVRLDFSLGSQRYTAVRVVRRTKGGGASTREARLERGEEIVAGNVRELDREVKRLIGLDFQQFTTCAVLPQGDFARFLHARPADRQKLLTQLLGFSVYAAMRQRAGQKAAIGRDRVEEARRRLEGLAGVTKKVEKAKAARLAGLKALRKEAADELSMIAELQGETESIRSKRAVLETRLRALGAVQVPDEASQLTTDVEAAIGAVKDAEERRDEAESELAKADVNLAALGDKGRLEKQRQLYRDREGRIRDLADAKVKSAEVRTEANELKAALAKATSSANAARETLAAGRRTHAAHELRGHLVAGEWCPVCGQSIVELPEGETPSALMELEAVERHAVEELNTVSGNHQKAERDLAAKTAVEAQVDQELEGISRRLADAPTVDEVAERLEQIKIAEQEQGRAKQELYDASAELRNAQQRRKDLAKRETAAWAKYDAARDGLSVLAGLPARTHNLANSWEHLQSWAAKLIPEIQEQDDELRTESERLAADLKGRQHRLAARFAEHDVAFQDDPTGNLLTAVNEARFALDGAREKRQEKKRLRTELKRARSVVDVADTLVRHLGAAGFERWLLHEAFGRLADSASNLLLELSNGQYAFQHNDRLEFEVIDHANAGETRSARTLSGGETFLASLSLALALADEVADLATEGTARLESIFLDEGFGTLDPDTLDVVATAIEELGAGGRMVGVVTHVPDLAQRIPIQFKVAKTAGTASVERVES